MKLKLKYNLIILTLSIIIVSLLKGIYNCRRSHSYMHKDLIKELHEKDSIINSITVHNIKLKESLLSAIKVKPEIKIIKKYEKITDTIISNPFKRDSILSERISFYIQNRSRFSPEGFNTLKLYNE